MNLFFNNIIVIIKKNTLFQFAKYFIFRFIIKRKYKSIFLNTKCKISQIENESCSSSFFGYYNISPFNKEGDLLLYNTNANGIRGSKEDSIKIRYISTNAKINKIIGQSSSWNWQQGCMLQWLPNSTNKIIFNDYDNSKQSYYCRILDIENGSERKIDKAIGSISKNGKFALSLNYDRLALMRPDYGYFNKEKINLPNDENDGIWYIDIENNKSKLIITLKDLQLFKPNNTMKNAMHKINHIDIAPDSNRFMFLHRWVGAQGRFMRLITADCMDGNNKFIVTGNDMVSHNCWTTRNQIISFCRTVDGRYRYVLYQDKVGLIKLIGENQLFRDGHPSISPDGNWMLTDDYPDRSRFSGLYLFNLKTNKTIELGKFYQPLKYTGEKRIDLHPKWSINGQKISIDSGHSGVRKFYTIDISNIVNEI